MTQPLVVVLSRRPLGPDDPVAAELAPIGARVVASSFEAPDFAEIAGDADAFVFSGGFPGAELARAPKCQIVARDGVGFDSVDIDAATKQGVWVTIIPDALVEDVADTAMMLLLAANRRLTYLDSSTRQGEWRQASADLFAHPPRKLNAATLGLVGFGRIGRAVAQRARGFGTKVIVADPVATADQAASAGAELVPLDALLERGDFVSIHVPLLESTRHLIGARELARMKPTAVLVNTSRGPVVDEAALIEALRAGRLRAAGLDVFEKEPVEPDNPLLTMPHVVLTPHIASISDVSNVERRREAAREVLRVLSGHEPRREAVANREMFAKTGART
jgi:phosphoglycerate dehydrogenase-like enzyme